MPQADRAEVYARWLVIVWSNVRCQWRRRFRSWIGRCRDSIE